MAPSVQGEPPPLEFVDDDDGGRFEPHPPDDGSPGRIIATMVGIVGILLLGSLFWSAVGSILGAVSQVGTIVPLERPTSIAFATASPQPTPLPTSRPAAGTAAEPTAVSTPAPSLAATPPATIAATPQPTPAATSEVAGRNPWILLPQPAPGSRVTAGQVTLEARGRGDAAITSIKLELDGAALPTNFEQRGESIWRGAASVRVTPGQHSARAIVVDEHGRTGSFRWNFEAAN